MKPEWVVLFCGVAFLAGAVLGIASAVFYVQWEQKLSGDEARWRRIDWRQQLDRRRELKRRFVADKGRSQW
jgi:hypothetical protein